MDAPKTRAISLAGIDKPGLQHGAVFCIGGLLTALVLIWLGFLDAEMSGPDEAAHFVSGVMVRQYLSTGVWEGIAPMAFAQDYYARYPKVAIGHWPPLFYLLQGIWYVLAGVSRESLLAFVALVSGSWSLTLAVVCRIAGADWLRAGVLGIWMSLSLQWIRSSVEFSSDPMTAVLTVWAAIACHFWLQSLNWRSGLGFALLGAAAILTKGNAFPLLLLPALVVFRRDRLRVWWQPRFWVPVLLIVAVTAPWYWLQRDLSVAEVVPGATRSLSGRMWKSAGVNLLNLDMLVFPFGTTAAVLLLALRSAKLEFVRLNMVFLALPAVCWLFLSFLSPHTEARLMIAAEAGFVVCCCAPVVRLHRGFWALLAVLMLYPLTQVAAKPQRGWVETAQWVRQLPDRSVLLASNHSGEGALIAEMALREPRPAMEILRASKHLQKSDWMGTRVKPLVQSPQDVRLLLESRQVQLVVMEINDAVAVPPTLQLLRVAVADWTELHRNQNIRVLRRP